MDIERINNDLDKIESALKIILEVRNHQLTVSHSPDEKILINDRINIIFKDMKKRILSLKAYVINFIYDGSPNEKKLAGFIFNNLNQYLKYIEFLYK